MITLSYKQSQWPTIKHERGTDGKHGTPNLFVYEVVNQTSVTGTQAEVVFEIVDPAKR